MRATEVSQQSSHSDLTSLHIVAASSLIPTQPLLVVRCLTAALLLAHTILFSCSGHFDYAHFDAWANAALLAAFLFLTFCSLLEIVSDHAHEHFVIAAPLSTNSNTLTDTGENASTSTASTSIPILDQVVGEPKRAPLLHRILAVLSGPLCQLAGSVVIFAAAEHWATGGVLFRSGTATPSRYVDLILHVVNPALYILDLILGCHLRQRLRTRYIPIAWLFIGGYYGFTAIAKRNKFPQGAKDIGIVVGLAFFIPILLVIVGRISTCIPRTRNRRTLSETTEEEEIENKPDEEKEKERQQDNEEKTTKSTPPDRPTVLPHSAGGDRARGTNERKRMSNTSHTSTGTGGIRQFGRIGSMGSVSSAASSGRLSRVGSHRFGRTLSTGSTGSSAWSGVQDVLVEMEPEKFRMPGVSGDEEGVTLPPRIARVRSTSLV